MTEFGDGDVLGKGHKPLVWEIDSVDGRRDARPTRNGLVSWFSRDMRILLFPIRLLQNLGGFLLLSGFPPGVKNPTQ